MEFTTFAAAVVFVLIKAGDGKEISSSGYIEYYPGTLNVVLAAPHGGYEKPSSIPARDAGCWDLNTQECIWTHSCGIKDTERCKGTTEEDWNTKELALLLRDAIFAEFGEYPYLVINNLHRTRLDANRDKDQAAFGEAIPGQAWEEFHGYIDSSKAEIAGRGLFIDVHGHGHPNNWAELGYLVHKPQLNSGEFKPNETAIRRLATEVNITFEELVRGPQSFGAFIEENRFSAIPSPSNPSPGENKFFCGGYNTRRHGSKGFGLIDGIQIESSRNQRSDDTRPQYARALAKALKSFMKTHYNYEGRVLRSSAPHRMDRIAETGLFAIFSLTAYFAKF